MYPALPEKVLDEQLGLESDEEGERGTNDRSSFKSRDEKVSYPQLQSSEESLGESYVPASHGYPQIEAALTFPILDRSTKCQALDKHRQQPEQFFATYKFTLEIFFSNSNYVQTPKGYTGLYNLGNTCFVNATLQALLHTPHFMDLFMDKLVAKHINVCSQSGTGGIISGCFSALVDAAWSGKFSAISPGCFMEIFANKVNSDLMDGRQHDAQEFQIYLLDALHEETNKIIQRSTFNQNYNGQNIVEEAEDYVRRAKNYSDSVVNSFFNMVAVSITECVACSFSTVTFESMNQISLEITESEEVVSIYRCLGRHFSEELLVDEGCQWSCSRCNANRIATRQTSLWSLPPILIIHLKRFFFDGCDFVKNESMVDWDCTAKLNMGSCMHREASKKDSLYHLYAVVNHDGNLKGGHYTSFVKNQIDGQWLKFNDEHCTWVDSSAVVTSKAFILYFVNNAWMRDSSLMKL